MNKGQNCRITKSIDEPTTGTLTQLPGNNPVQGEGVRATMFSDPNTPTLLSPVYAYTGNTPPAVGKPVSLISAINATSNTAVAMSSTTSSALSSTPSHSSSHVDASPSPPAGNNNLAPTNSALNVASPHPSSTSSAAPGATPSSGSSPPSTGCKPQHKKHRHKKGRRLMQPHGWAS